MIIKLAVLFSVCCFIFLIVLAWFSLCTYRGIVLFEREQDEYLEKLAKFEIKPDLDRMYTTDEYWSMRDYYNKGNPFSKS